jgi:tRNA (cytidine/uridine-2'-O-)-methyltransferase
MFSIVLVAPEIPPNTGNVIRLAANTGCALHLVEPLGFSMDDKLLKRAGLDYHEHARVQRHAGWPDFLASAQPAAQRCFAFTTHAGRSFADVAWQTGDWLVFGNETAGLAPALRASFAPAQCLRLPMRTGQRSLNRPASALIPRRGRRGPSAPAARPQASGGLRAPAPRPE